jgi:hypothetical protein
VNNFVTTTCSEAVIEYGKEVSHLFRFWYYTVLYLKITEQLPTYLKLGFTLNKVRNIAKQSEHLTLPTFVPRRLWAGILMGRSGHSYVHSLITGTKMVCEMFVNFNQLTRLIAGEDFIKIQSKLEQSERT